MGVLPNSQVPRLEIDRAILDRAGFDDVTAKTQSASKPMLAACVHTMRASCWCQSEAALRRLHGLFPFVNMLRMYKPKKYLVHDLIAGISVGMVHIPQGMGFAMLANVSPVYGLYSSFFPVLIYFFFGSSTHVSVGTMALISLILGSVVQTEADKFVLNRNSSRNGFGNFVAANSTLLPPANDADPELEEFKASIAAAMSLVAGAIMLLMGIFRLGIITTFMSGPFIGGFTAGAAFHISASQFNSLFGIRIHAYKGVLQLPYTWIEICRQLPTANVPTVIVAILSLVILIVFKEFLIEKIKKKLPIPIPIEMLVLIATTLFSHFLFFHDRWDIQVVGSIPRGIPLPFMPPVHKVTDYMKDAVIAAILSFAISIAMADIFSRKHKYVIDSNQELIACGLAYGVSSFFYCFIGAAAPPRCFLLDSTGCKTQVASFFTSILLLLVLLLIGPLFQSLPRCVLACIIITALFPLFKQFKCLPGLWRISKADFSIWLVTWTSSILLSLEISLGVGIAWSVLTIALVAMSSNGHMLGQAKYPDLFAPTKDHASVTVPEGIVIYRYESNLFFTNIKKFKEQLYKAAIDPQDILRAKAKDHLDSISTNVPEVIASNGKMVVAVHPVATKNSAAASAAISTIILDCSPFGYVDLMGLDLLKQLNDDYKAIGVKFVLANCTETLIRKLEIDGQVGGEGGDLIHLYPTIQDALGAVSPSHPALDRVVTCL